MPIKYVKMASDMSFGNFIEVEKSSLTTTKALLVCENVFFFSKNRHKLSSSTQASHASILLANSILLFDQGELKKSKKLKYLIRKGINIKTTHKIVHLLLVSGSCNITAFNRIVITSVSKDR